MFGALGGGVGSEPGGRSPLAAAYAGSMKLPSFLSAFSFWATAAAAASLVFALAACTGANDALGGNATCVTTACGTGSATYQACTSQAAAGSSCADITYKVNGQSFTCNSCQGCTSAASQVAMACLDSVDPGDGGNEASGNQTCSTPTACGAGGRTYQECSTLDAAGTCVTLDYKTSDGHTFTCAGCQGCATVAENLAAYCAGEAQPDSGPGMTSCSTSVSCGTSGVTYKECTTTGAGGACESIKYELSSGASYTCASCGDCGAAVTALEGACSATTAPTTTCTSWSSCGSSGSSLQYEECTSSLNGACQSMYYQTSDGQSFACNSCSDCTGAVSSMETYCTNQTMPTTTCSAYSACGGGGIQYELCTTTQAGNCTSEYYATTDSHTFTCSGCNCSSAGSSLDAYCASLTATTCGSGTCTAGNLCCNCSGTMGCYSSNGGTYTCASYSCQ